MTIRGDNEARIAGQITRGALPRVITDGLLDWLMSADVLTRLSADGFDDDIVSYSRCVAYLQEFLK